MELRTRFLFNLLLILASLLCASQALRFNVGGKYGWVPNPSESYNHWAERNRFQVNDTLYFKYKQGQDSVLVVSQDDYDRCNTQNPIHSFADGDTVFTFDRSGPFFFTSGVADGCNQGEKLIVVVLAVRAPNTPPTHAPPPPTTVPPISAPPGRGKPEEGINPPAHPPNNGHSAAASVRGPAVGLGSAIVVLSRFAVGLFVVALIN